MSISTRPRSLAVHFSQVNHIAVTPKDGIQSKAYSTSDMGRFKQDLVGDVRHMARVLANTPAEMITQEDLVECLGLEMFLDRGVARKAQEKKQAHIDAIITGQHLYEPDELAQLSSITSSWFRNRAVECAQRYRAFSHE